MKLYIKPLMGVCALILSVCNVNAISLLCPEGCFCMNGGYSTYVGYTENGVLQGDNRCIYPATSLSPGSWIYQYGSVWVSGGQSSSININADYYVDEFSEFYEHFFGFYGFINNQFVYAYDHGFDLLQCPYTYPNSERGASALTQCFRYDANGNKIYYGSGQTVTCSEGTYLPANATSCIACQPSKNQVCPGGTFAKSDKVQGLKVFCVSGQYLNANATQCSQCDDARYLCPGGLYNVDAEEHGRIKHNGYININNYGISKKVSSIAAHKFVTCNPGNYMPANSKECATCFGNYACPGGLFYTDVIYNEPRGLVACGYGYPNADRTQCVMQSSSPSFMKKKVSGNISTTDTIKTDTPVKQAIEKKVSDAKVIIPTTSRSVIARPEVVPMEYDEPVPVHKRVNVHRAAKVMPQTAKTIQSEIIRERPGVKRPSKRK